MRKILTLARPRSITRRDLIVGSAALSGSLVIPRPARAATARYWRLVFEWGSTSNSEMGLWEIELRASSGGADETTTDTSKATSSSNRGAGTEAYRATDNNGGTEWRTNANQSIGSWWKWDFGAGNEKEIVEVYWTTRADNSLPPEYVLIQRSSDNSLWTDVWDQYTSTSASPVTITLPTGSPTGGVNFWRLRAPAGGSDSTYCTVAKIQMRATSGGADVAEDTTTGLGINSSRSAYTQMANQAFDTNSSSLWQSAASQNIGAWIGKNFFDHIAPADLEEVVVTAPTGAEMSQTPFWGVIEKSTDAGVNWTPMWHWQSPSSWTTGQTQTFTRAAGIVLTGGHRYYRIRSTAIQGGGNIFSTRYIAMKTGPSAPNIGGMCFYTADSGTTPYNAGQNFDNNAWVSANVAGDHWIAFDFGTGNAPLIKNFSLQADASSPPVQAPTNFVFEWSDDYVSWYSALSVSGLSWTQSETKEFEVVGGRSRGFIIQ